MAANDPTAGCDRLCPRGSGFGDAFQIGSRATLFKGLVYDSSWWYGRDRLVSIGRP